MGSSEPGAPMNLMEYQGKELFKRCGIPVPRSGHARHAATRSWSSSRRAPGDWVVKAQVLMGGRGKAGKIKFASDADARPRSGAEDSRNADAA